MAKRSKQQKPCPNHPACRFPTKNRQAKLHLSQEREIRSVDRDVVLEGASICSSCGCVYKPGDYKWPVIIGFHDDPLIEDRDSDQAIWWAVEED